MPENNFKKKTKEKIIQHIKKNVLGILTDEQIKEAIKKKQCPYCGGKTFTGHLEWADELFSIEKDGKIIYSLIESSAGYDAVVCKNCEEEIYPIIWREWLIFNVKKKKG